MKKDFDFTAQLMNEFFDQNHIQERFKLIQECEISGYEIWLQVEVAAFFNAHSLVADWKREVEYSIDRRVMKHRNRALVDLIFRKKHSSTDKWIGLEIKQNQNLSACLRGIMEDTLKLNAVKDSEDNLRCFWSLGVFQASNENVHDKLMNSANSHNFELPKNCFQHHKIGDSGYEYLVC